MKTTQTMVLKDNKWVEINFMDLKINDRFQLINPDGLYHMDEYGKTDWVASSNPYVNENGIYEIKTY
jgi:hypothetical protein